ncbi:MAG: hypothetical protein MUC65_05455, partial [Pontiellaceae bacterium]|nr:hypothetical protein [Pontiellaceae bacterium]
HRMRKVTKLALALVAVGSVASAAIDMNFRHTTAADAEVPKHSAERIAAHHHTTGTTGLKQIQPPKRFE